MAGFELIAAVWAAVDKLAHAYTTGQGLARHEHDPRLFTGVARFYATMYRNSLLTEWLPAVDGLIEELESGIRVLDVGCGLGVLTVLLAEAFPNSTFVGVDYHAESIHQATSAAEEGASPTAFSSTSPTPRRTPAATTWRCSSTPSTTSATRSQRSGTRAACWHWRSSPSSRTPRTPWRPTGQPDSRGVLRRQLGPCVPHVFRGRRRTRRPGRSRQAHRGVRGRRLLDRGRGHHNRSQPGDPGASLTIPNNPVPLAERDRAAASPRH